MPVTKITAHFLDYCFCCNCTVTSGGALRLLVTSKNLGPLNWRPSFFTGHKSCEVRAVQMLTATNDKARVHPASLKSNSGRP